MRKLYLILVLFTVVMGALKAAPKKDSIEHLQKGRAMGYCNPPIINADSLLLEYYTNQPLSATGGVPPYTYTFSPAISSSELVSPPDSSITYTITVTGADGCDSVYYAHYVPLPPGSTGACDAIFISEYIQDTVNHDNAIELYNPTGSNINLSNYYLFGTTNGSLLSTPFFIPLHGTIDAYQTFLIANTLADTSLTHKAKMLSDSLNFGGKDIVTLSEATISPPTLTVNFLDEVGTIYPLPTDSGWAVGRGSTKNHTLVREVSVAGGDLNWSTCKNEWNVYSRGTFSYIGHYTNSCHIDPKLILSLANGTVVCGNPSYYKFSIMASSDSTTQFNSCMVNFTFSGAEFAGDNADSNNYSVVVEPAPNFNNLKYWTSTAQTGNDVNIAFGSTYDSSLDGTVLTNIPQDMIHVSLKIQNSCAPGSVILADTGVAFGYYVKADSVLDTVYMVKSSYSVSTYQCGDSVGPPYECNPYCCDTDAYGNCDSICYWDTCTIYPIYCNDTTWSYAPDSVYGITSYANLRYTNVVFSPWDSLSNSGSGCQPVIEPLAPVNAGTNSNSDPPNSSILTINGNNFGNVKGLIMIPDANKGGGRLMALDSMDILSWSNSQIVIRMPSVELTQDTMIPGSGHIIIYNSCTDSSQTNLTINYNIIGTIASGEKLRDNMAMSDDTNSIVFHCDTSISNHPRIYADVLEAISEWNCYTGINWKMGDDMTGDTVSTRDGISSIYFTNSLPPGHLMETTPYVDNGCNDFGDSMAYVHEADIAISRILPPGYTWNYDVSDSVIPGNYYYFYDVLLHELGHAHLLNHVDDPTSLMYYSFNSYTRKNLLSGTYPGPQTLYGGFDVVNTSAANTPSCSYGILIPSPRVCVDTTLNVHSVTGNIYQLSLYPNPVSNQDLTISYELKQNSYIQFKIIDYTGREIMIMNNEQKMAGSYKERINTETFASGIYLFIANINGTVQTIKFIKM